MRPLLRELSLTQVPIALVALGVGCSFLGALCARSFFLFDSVEFVRDHAVWEAAIKRGRLVFDNSPQMGLERKFVGELHMQIRTYSDHLQDIPGDASGEMAEMLEKKHPEWKRIFPRFALVEKQAGRPGTPPASRSYALWPSIVAINLLCIAAIFARGYRTYRRLHLGRCTRCGYDLRASGAICPECGKSRLIEGTGSISRNESRDRLKQAAG